jgi:membrane protein YqaA with SNARE-associated domain
MDRESGMGRPFGAGISLGMVAGIVIGSLVTWWLGEATLDLLHRAIERITTRREPPQFELLLQ